MILGLDRRPAARQALLDSGAQPFGWKVGLGALASLELMQIPASSPGSLADASVHFDR